MKPIRCVLWFAIALSSCNRTASSRPPTEQAQPVAQDPCGASDTQLEMTRCWQKVAEKAEQEAANTYARTAAWLRSRNQPGALERLEQSQSLWETYRTAQCAAATALYEGGSMAGMQQVHCRARLAEQRKTELETLLKDAGS